MRVSTMQMHNTMSGNIQQASGSVSKTMMQLSANKRILSPSDDVFASTQLMGLDDDLFQLEVWSSNIGSATTILSNQETALKDINNNMNRARDLVLSTGNGSMSQEDLNAVAVELEQVLETMADITNTQSSSGEYIFGGTRGNQASLEKVTRNITDEHGDIIYESDGVTPKTEEVWVSQSSDDARKLEISDSQKAELGVTSNDLYGGDAEFFNEMEDFIAALRSGDTSTIDQAIDQTIEMIDKHQKNVNQAITTIGAEINTLEAAETTNADRQLVNKSMQSSLEDLDYAEATTRLSIEQTMLTAAQKSYSSTIQLSLFNYV